MVEGPQELTACGHTRGWSGGSIATPTLPGGGFVGGTGDAQGFIPSSEGLRGLLASRHVPTARGTWVTRDTHRAELWEVADAAAGVIRWQPRGAWGPALLARR